MNKNNQASEHICGNTVPAIPMELQQAVEQAHVAMLGHPNHHLLPIHRRTIYTVLRHADRVKARRTLGQLALLAARRAAPIWQTNRPDDFITNEVLDMAQHVLGGTADLSAAADLARRAWRHIEDLADSYGAELHRSLIAGEAAVTALYETLGEDPFAGIKIDEQTTDADLDPWSSDTAVLAVSAWAGAAWEPVSDAAKRREFWEWWLCEAIPKASQASHN